MSKNIFFKVLCGACICNTDSNSKHLVSLHKLEMLRPTGLVFDVACSKVTPA